MATELNIPQDPAVALDTVVNGKEVPCDVIKINESECCIHLSDIGLNARLVKYYHKSAIHGMWGYVRMLLKILIQGKPVNAHIVADDFETDIPAYMIVFANATKYGTGAMINPRGSIGDGEFELVVVRQVSLIEFAKLFLRSRSLSILKKSKFSKQQKQLSPYKRETHFQVDGEYLGKTNKVTAEIIPGALSVIVPKERMGCKENKSV